jgi:hypothetical protein
VQILIDHGVDPNAQTADTTPLLTATAAGNHETVKHLLTRSARMDVRGRDGRNSFDVALETRDKRIIELFLCQLDPSLETQIDDILVLDKALRDWDVERAGSILATGADVPSRAMKTLGMRHVGLIPIIGSDNEYLKSVCSAMSLARKGILSKDSPAEDFRLNLTCHRLLGWMLDCLTNHPCCINTEGALPFLPSRVIDLGPSDGSNDPVLRESSSTRGRYVALSHRWGNLGQAKLTTANRAARLQSIRFHQLTKTMQHAVLVTRKLKVRYLWIDALCIIQDSDSDWKAEACNMANIYQNALVTIAAGTSSDHSDGMFTEKQARQRPNTAWPDEDFLGRRGWILQEQLLPSRTVKYSSSIISWECKTSVGNAHQNMSPEFMRFRRALAGVRSTSMPLEQQAHASWQHIVQDFSQRELTNPKDKLMALMGIADFIGKIMKDRFLAGIWEGQFWKDLLWSSVDRKLLRPTVLIMPSWSWVSVGGPVKYELPGGSSAGSMRTAVSLRSASVDPNLSSFCVQGRLVMEGRMRKYFLWEGEDDFSIFRWRLTVLDSRRRHNDCKRGIKWSGELFRDTNEQLPEEVFVLQIASQPYWIHCIVLIPTAEPNVYRRVGLCHVDTTNAPTFELSGVVTII